MMRQGNTIFIVHQDKSNPVVAVFRAVNADTLPNYLKNCIEFTKAVGMMGFKYLVTQFHDESLLKIFEYVRRNQPFKNMGYEANRTVDGGYQVIVNLGETPRVMAISEQKKFVQGNK